MASPKAMAVVEQMEMGLTHFIAAMVEDTAEYSEGMFPRPLPWPLRVGAGAEEQAVRGRAMLEALEEGRLVKQGIALITIIPSVNICLEALEVLSRRAGVPPPGTHKVKLPSLEQS